MSDHHYNQSVVFKVLLIGWLFSSIVNGQSPVPPSVGSPYGQSPEVSVPEEVSSPEQQPSLRKFTFKHAKAADVLRILIQLSSDDNPNGLSVDERTNSFVFLADAQDASESEATFNLLDAETPVTVGTGKGLSVSVPALGPEPLAFDFSIGFERGGSIESLKEQYNVLEQQAHQLADKLKQSTSPIETQRTELQLAVRKSFEARQTLQRAELADLARRMQSMQQSIDMRDKLADKVVERRIEDLLNPNLKWDTIDVREQMLAGPGGVSSDSNVALSQSPSNPQSSGPGNRSSLSRTVPPANTTSTFRSNEQPETIKERMQGRWIVESISDGDETRTGDTPNASGPFIFRIEGNLMQPMVGTSDDGRPVLLVDCENIDSSQVEGDGPLLIDLDFDPNGDSRNVHHGIIACDGETLSICMAGEPQTIPADDFRPNAFVAGSRVTLWKLRRARDGIAYKDDLSSEPGNDQRQWAPTPTTNPSVLAADESKTTDSSSPSVSPLRAAVMRLLARLPRFSSPDGSPAAAPIAFVGIDYNGPWEVGDFKEELHQQIEAQISQSVGCSVVSRRLIEAAMRSQHLKLNDMTAPEMRQKFISSLRSLDVKAQGIMFARLKHMVDSDSTPNGAYEVSLELFDVNQRKYNERAIVQKDQLSSDSTKQVTGSLQGRWIVKSWSKASEDQLAELKIQLELKIEGHVIHIVDENGDLHAAMLLDEQNIEPDAYNGNTCPVNYVIDPNGECNICPGILELDGEHLRICYCRSSLDGANSDKFRPSQFLPGSKVTLIECLRGHKIKGGIKSKEAGTE